MGVALKFVTVAIGLSSIAFAAPTASNVVDLEYARYQGYRNQSIGITTYYGLPYAAPPIGSLRWQPPVPIEDSGLYTGNPLINATAPGSRCVQGTPAWNAEIKAKFGSTPSTQPQSEDCLHLDVIVPSNPAASSLSVVVQIHGGGYASGSSIAADGSYFVSFSSGTVIYVSIQYRLGVYGFLSGSEIKKSGTPNAGLLDQRLALEWVRKHIAAFGGDPARVTIWGGSAGGGSVTNQMILYGGDSNPPFRAAIAEYPWWQPFHDDEILQTQYDDLLATTSCSNLECLRGLPEAALANASQALYLTSYNASRYAFGDYYFGPSVDGKIIRDLPQEEFRAGHFIKVPLLTDHDAYEGITFSNFSIKSESDVKPDLQRLWPHADTTFFNNLFDLYPKTDYQDLYFLDPILNAYATLIPNLTHNSAFYQRQSIFGDFAINCPTYYIATALTSANQSVWKMWFRAGTEIHGATAAFLLGSSIASGDSVLAGQMKSYFLSFIVYLDPNVLSSAGAGVGVPRPVWPRYGLYNRVLDVQRQQAVSVSFDSELNARCRFFGDNRFVVRN